MKRKSLAFLLALIMILTLVPASAFAATNNTVTTVPTVSTNANMPVVTLNMVVTDVTGMPQNVEQTVRFTLENGTWAISNPSTSNIATTTALTVATAAGVSVEAANSGGSSVTVAVVPQAVGSDYVELTVKPTSGDIGKDGYLTFKFGIKSGDEAGDVKVKVESVDAQFSNGTYTVGVVAGGKTTAAVSGKVKTTGRTNDVETAIIEIREVSVNSVKAGLQDITLTLPKGFSWNDTLTTATGNMVTGGTASVGIVSGTDGRDLSVSFTAISTDARQLLSIKPFINVASKDARFGDITVQIRTNDGEISKASGLVIAVYGEEEVTVTTVKEKDLPEIYAGYEKDGNDTYDVEVTIEEASKGSLIGGKYIDFEFPEWVQLSDDVTVKTNGGTAVPVPNLGKDVSKDTSSFEWAVTGIDPAKANKFVFTIPVTVEAGHTGDLELVVSGAKAGLSETKLVVAKVIPTVTMEAKLSDIRLGIQKQGGGTIVIKETEPGAIREGLLSISIDDLGFKNAGMKFNAATVKVTGGDLEIKEAKKFTSGGALEITVSRQSIKDAAEITISDVEITLDRTLPQGKYEVGVGGAAVVDNSNYNDGDFAGDAASAEYVNITTPADQGALAKFVIGDKAYTSNNESKTMDVAPYIDGANRTMMPIRYVAEALGLTENQIVWDQATQTATIFGEKVVTIKMGSNQLVAGGTPVTMDTVAINKDSRIFVPARFVANALGASVEWDAATKAVTIFTVK